MTRTGNMCTVREALFCVADRDPLELPDGPDYWLRHYPPSSSWWEAPRAEWLLYLARACRLGEVLIARVEQAIVQAAIEIEGERGRGYAGRDKPLPITIAADRARDVIERYAGENTAL